MTTRWILLGITATLISVGCGASDDEHSSTESQAIGPGLGDPALCAAGPCASTGGTCDAHGTCLQGCENLPLSGCTATAPSTPRSSAPDAPPSLLTISCPGNGNGYYTLSFVATNDVPWFVEGTTLLDGPFPLTFDLASAQCTSDQGQLAPCSSSVFQNVTLCAAPGTGQFTMQKYTCNDAAACVTIPIAS